MAMNFINTRYHILRFLLLTFNYYYSLLYLAKYFAENKSNPVAGKSARHLNSGLGSTTRPGLNQGRQQIKEAVEVNGESS
jgi:hypothetical protein